MSTLDFDRTQHTVCARDADGHVIAGPFVAYNNVDSHSKGRWPDGMFVYLDYHSHPALSDPDSEYGSHGILIFDVPNRTGMGVHSGRQEVPDGLGRKGPAHATMGCIRTTDDAIAAFLAVTATDALSAIQVGTPAAAVIEAPALESVRAPQKPVKRRKKVAKKVSRPRSTPKKRSAPRKKR